MPSGISFTEAAALSAVFATAQYALFHLGRLPAGESILIHAVAGSVGEATVVLALNAGAKIFATVSSLKKRQILVENCNVAEGNCFYSHDTSFVTQVLARTSGRGMDVDVVLNLLSGQSLIETWRCVAPLGRFIEISKLDSAAMKSFPMAPFDKIITFNSVDLQVLLKQVILSRSVF